MCDFILVFQGEVLFSIGALPLPPTPHPYITLMVGHNEGRICMLASLAENLWPTEADRLGCLIRMATTYAFRYYRRIELKGHQKTQKTKLEHLLGW